MSLNKLIYILSFAILLSGCSSSYKKLSKMEIAEGNNFQQYLLNEYSKKAKFEANEMHDWNSAKLYSEKALASLESHKIYPEKITYWKLPLNKVNEIRIAHESLMAIYDNAKIIDPYNLAKAISSLDCWSEQQEENWQKWDINKCREDFLNSMHNIYKKISANNEEELETKKTISKNITEDEATIITKNKDDEIIQIIYFDFDKINLSNVSVNSIKNFLEKNKSKINEYLIVGHTDTKGTRQYNLSLSIKRAEFVKNILIKNGIKKEQIDILGKGEEFLASNTPDDTKHPANRRVEIKKSN